MTVLGNRQRRGTTWGGMMPHIEDGILSVIQGRSGLISFHVTEGEGRTFIAASVKSPAETREAASLSYSQITEVLSERGMAIVHERIFGSLGVERDVMSARRQAFTSFGISPDSPVTYIEGNPPWGKGLAGVIIHAVKAGEVWTVMDSGVPCGRGWRLNGETHLILQNIQALDRSFRTDTKKSKSNSTLPSFPDLIGESRTALDARLRPAGMTNKVAACTLTNKLLCMSENKPHQARLMLENAERILRDNGASYKDVVRTWFYLSDNLGWYAAFNKVRNEKYGEFGIMPGPGDRELLLPASTGIQGETPSGAACAMDLIAVIGHNPEKSSSLSFPQVKRVGNPSEKKDSGQVRCGSPRGVAPTGMTELQFRCGITNDRIGKTRPSIR